VQPVREADTLTTTCEPNIYRIKCTQHRPLQPITVIALHFLYVDDVHTSQKTHLWAPTVYYRDNFIF
jgi:hypothetical protein